MYVLPWWQQLLVYLALTAPIPITSLTLCRSKMKLSVFTVACFVVGNAARPQLRPNPYFAATLRPRQTSGGNSSSLEVDLGYEVYQGHQNTTTGLNLWRGYFSGCSNIRVL